ncbi:hypothetical protein [Tessaracoccus sp. ZS01]|uniref:hypothetical protein n=1 Tax=Tessaracoccus sp. ZS01 TaxID=1906324 RepID=UPI0018EA1956|nr:hypothetical protein [Tessaracoccus sp. ZS01]
MKVNPSALRHGISEEDIMHAARHPSYLSEPDDDMPAKQFALGFDTHGRLLELAILTFDSGQPSCHPRDESSVALRPAARMIPSAADPRVRYHHFAEVSPPRSSLSL